MKHGDISNELPKRLLVTTDLIMDIKVSVKKKLLIIPSVKINKTFRRDILSYLYLYTSRAGVTLELVSYNLDEENLSEAMRLYQKNPSPRRLIALKKFLMRMLWLVLLNVIHK